MNFDRAISIVSVTVGFAGVAIGIYSTRTDASSGLLIASGWIAAILLSITTLVLSFRALSAVERSRDGTIGCLESALSRAEARNVTLSNDVKALQEEVTEYKNISRALSSVVAPIQKPRAPRANAKRPNPISISNPPTNLDA